MLSIIYKIEKKDWIKLGLIGNCDPSAVHVVQRCWSFLGGSRITKERSGIIMRPEIFRTRAHDLSRGRESAGALLRITFNALDSVINPFGCICSHEKSVDRARRNCVTWALKRTTLETKRALSERPNKFARVGAEKWGNVRGKSVNVIMMHLVSFVSRPLYD